MRTTIVIASLAAAVTAQAQTPDLASWRPAPVAPAPEWLDNVTPAGARVLEARGGERLRFTGKAKPQVGRVWRSGETIAYLDETDGLVAAGDHAWQYVVPLGAHEVVAVAGDVTIERVVARDPGYGWEVYEDQLVDWGDSASRAAPPAPPSGDAQEAWIEARAAAALLDAAGTLDAGGRSLRTAIALDGVAKARPLVQPYYRPTEGSLSERSLGAPAIMAATGPSYVRVVAHAATPGRAAALRITLDGAWAGGGPLALGPGTSNGVPGFTATPSEWVVRVPAGRHLLHFTAQGKLVVAAESYRKREHVEDAVTGDEDVDGRAAAQLHAKSPLVAAEAQRLAGREKAARKAFAALLQARDPATRAYAAWRLGELDVDAAAAVKAFAVAEAAVASLPESARAAAAAAIGLARARRDIIDGATLDPALWGEPSSAAALAGGDGDTGGGPARLAAAIAAAPLRGAAALRRAYFDRTMWKAAPSPALTLSVLSQDSAATCDDELGGGYDRLVAQAREIDVPADPLGSSRFLAIRVTAFAPQRAALDEEIVVDGKPLPLPVVVASEDHRIALAPGKHQIAARGGADVYLQVPRGGDLSSVPGATCDRHHRRGYATIGAEPTDFPIAAPGGAIVGLDVRVLDPTPGRVVDALVRVDGRDRRLRVRANTAQGGGAARPVSPAVTVDMVAADPRSLALRAPAAEAPMTDERRLGPGRRQGSERSEPERAQQIDRQATEAQESSRLGPRLLARPLFRVTRPSAAALEAGRAAALAEKLLAAVPNPAPSADINDTLRRLSEQILLADGAGARARLLLARARVLAQLGHPAYADEDLRRAVQLVPEAGYQTIVDTTRNYVEPVAGEPGYSVEPAAALLSQLRADPEAQEIARRVRAGVPATPELAALKDVKAEPHDAALAIRAFLDTRDANPTGAAIAYAALAQRHPDDARLAAAEANARLDEASTAAKVAPGTVTRAYIAALRAKGVPGAADAMARAAAATRWRAVAHADSAPGSVRGAVPLAPNDHPGLMVRAALLAPDLDVGDALWLNGGEVARAVLSLPRPAHVRATWRCADLRPGAAVLRPTDTPCRTTLRVDGEERKDGDLGQLPAGDHAVELTLAAGGLDALAAVRFTTDARLPGAAQRPVDGGFLLGARVETTRILADAGEPAELAVLGPTVLQLEAAGAPEVSVAEVGAPKPLAVVAAAPAGRAAVILPEARPYRLEVRPSAGRAAVAVAVREDRAAPTAKPLALLAAVDRPDPPAPSAPPAVPATQLRFVGDKSDFGTVTFAETAHAGHLGERDDPDNDQYGGRYLETSLSYRRRGGNAWWRADVLGRLRPEGTPSAGVGARVLLRAGELRLFGGALGVTQYSDTGTLVTGWFDVGTALRHHLGGDWFVTPSLGYVLRDGVFEDPGGRAIDPDVWSEYDAWRNHRAFGQVRLDWEPFLDLHARARARTVMAEGQFDRVGALLGLSGTFGRLGWGTSFELERRFAVLTRAFPVTRPIWRADLGYAIWKNGSDRLSLGGATAVRAGESTEVLITLSYDWTFGRGLADYAPDEQEFAAQLGPYAEEP